MKLVKDYINHLQDVVAIIPDTIYELSSTNQTTKQIETRIVQRVERMDRMWACKFYGECEVIKEEIDDNDLVLYIKEKR